MFEVSGTPAEEGDDENPIIDQPAALLIAHDPTGETAVRFVWVADLSQADYERYNTALKALEDIASSSMFAYLRQSGFAMMREVGEAYKAIYDNQISLVQMGDVQEWCLRLRGGVLGFCSALVQHQEQAYIEVKRKFGDGSPEHEDMKTVFNSLFDNNFGYRHLYKLRNAMVHYSLFACGVGAESHRREDQNIHWFELKYDRRIMLEQASFLNARLRRELEELDEDPDIMEMLSEAVKDLALANRRVVEIMHPDIGALCRTVVQFDNLFGNQDGVRTISSQRSQHLRRPLRFNYRPVPPQVILSARNRVRREQGQPEQWP
ncbi:hypothetical protein A5761_13785 [Mycolicibacterium setense]|uniref:hypothetical protein n=1 Tax=Mycolicibacterium setense TaxID=431269 RepID=UPI0007EAC60F|nr:hypothetical protein [Mycolicibacterium setense]OBB15187.1 hypothetical protein A5761_13785 [Mycolicibacterium setense]